MRMLWELFFKEEKEPEEVFEPGDEVVLGNFQELRKFLKSSMALATPSVYSSNNSLLSCYSYGDIYALIQVTNETLEALMLDRKFDFEPWNQKRSPMFIRSIFVTSDGEFPDVAKTLQELRWATLRLAEGYELRRQHLDLGMYVYQNTFTAEFLLNDLDSFFTEIFHEYRVSKPGYDPSVDRR